MNCKTVLPLLSAFVDSELTGTETLAVRDHLRACPSCSREAELVRAVKTRLSSLATAEAPEQLESRLQRAVFNRKSEHAQKYAIGALIAATSMVAALLAMQVSGKPATPNIAGKKDSSHALDAAADRAFLTGSDPIAGSVPVVTVSYAGDH